MKPFTIHDTADIRKILAGNILTERIPVTSTAEPTIHNCPNRSIDELFWVQEPFGESKVRDRSVKDGISLIHHAWRYKEDYENRRIWGFHREKTKAGLYKWESADKMPQDASRVTLRIVSIELEEVLGHTAWIVRMKLHTEAESAGDLQQGVESGRVAA